MALRAGLAFRAGLALRARVFARGFAFVFGLGFVFVLGFGFALEAVFLGRALGFALARAGVLFPLAGAFFLLVGIICICFESRS